MNVPTKSIINLLMNKTNYNVMINLLITIKLKQLLTFFKNRIIETKNRR